MFDCSKAALGGYPIRISALGGCDEDGVYVGEGGAVGGGGEGSDGCVDRGRGESWRGRANILSICGYTNRAPEICRKSSKS